MSAARATAAALRPILIATGFALAAGALVYWIAAGNATGAL